MKENTPLDAPETKRASDFKEALKWIWKTLTHRAAFPYLTHVIFFALYLKYIGSVEGYICLAISALWYIAYAIREHHTDIKTGDIFITKKDPNEPIK